MFFKTKRVVVFLFLTLALPLAAGAIEYGGLGGLPANPNPADSRTGSWFIYNLAPGEKKQDALLVVNNTAEDVTVFVYPQDSTPSSDGGFALKQLNEGRGDVGAWVTLFDEPPKSLATTSPDITGICATERKKSSVSQTHAVLEWCQGKSVLEVTLLKQSTYTVPFVIAIPEQVDVGEHTGGILIQKKETAPATSGSEQGGIVISTRVGVRIYETIPGEVKKHLTLSRFTVEHILQQQRIRATIGLQNSGNVSADVKISLAVFDPLFRSNRQVIDRETQVLREDELVSNFDFQEPRIGILRFQPTITYQDSEGREQIIKPEPLTVYVIPWVELVAGAVGLILIIGSLIILWRLKQKRYSTAGWVEYAVRPGETITGLAERLGVHWKILAKANGIKAPYVLEAGQKIKLPPLPVKEDGKPKRDPDKALKIS